MNTKNHNLIGVWSGASGDAQGVLRVVPAKIAGDACLQENPHI